MKFELQKNMPSALFLLTSHVKAVHESQILLKPLCGYKGMEEIGLSPRLLQADVQILSQKILPPQVNVDKYAISLTDI